jgi:hypothetical protein
MKKDRVLVAMLGVALALGASLAFVGCDTDSGDGGRPEVTVTMSDGTPGDNAFDFTVSQGTWKTGMYFPDFETGIESRYFEWDGLGQNSYGKWAGQGTNKLTYTVTKVSTTESQPVSGDSWTATATLIVPGNAPYSLVDGVDALSVWKVAGGPVALSGTNP